MDAIVRARATLDALTDVELARWGYARVDPPGPSAQRVGELERRALVLLRRNIHRNAFGRMVRRVRAACDVLLREGGATPGARREP